MYKFLFKNFVRQLFHYTQKLISDGCKFLLGQAFAVNTHHILNAFPFVIPGIGSIKIKQTGFTFNFSDDLIKFFKIKMTRSFKITMVLL